MANRRSHRVEQRNPPCFTAKTCSGTSSSLVGKRSFGQKRLHRKTAQLRTKSSKSLLRRSDSYSYQYRAKAARSALLKALRRFQLLTTTRREHGRWFESNAVRFAARESSPHKYSNLFR